MHTIAITKNKSMNVPASFTLKELMKANPDVKYNTLYQRLQVLVKEGALELVGDVKRPEPVAKLNEDGTPVLDKKGEPVMEKKNKKGRTEIVYKLPGTSDKSNLIRQVAKQGRQGKVTTNVPVASVDASTAPDTSADSEAPAVVGTAIATDATSETEATATA
jgi:hypothetical protein